MGIHDFKNKVLQSKSKDWGDKRAVQIKAVGNVLISGSFGTLTTGDGPAKDQLIFLPEKTFSVQRTGQKHTLFTVKHKDRKFAFELASPWVREAVICITVPPVSETEQPQKEPSSQEATPVQAQPVETDTGERFCVWYDSHSHGRRRYVCRDWLVKGFGHNGLTYNRNTALALTKARAEEIQKSAHEHGYRKWVISPFDQRPNQATSSDDSWDTMEKAQLPPPATLPSTSLPHNDLGSNN